MGEVTVTFSSSCSTVVSAVTAAVTGIVKGHPDLHIFMRMIHAFVKTGDIGATHCEALEEIFLELADSEHRDDALIAGLELRLWVFPFAVLPGGPKPPRPPP